ncbi:MAG: peptide chain release factor N(5)-glutamine methyltransferase, partial [Solirubrobacteraceae bacterium]
MPELGLAGRSIADALREATSILAGAGCDTPRLDAELLLAAVLDVDRSRLVIDAQAELSDDALARFDAFVTRRSAREPVAYILGRKAFRRITLSVDRRVLIPRPETELLVELALELEPRTVLDVGTGSGAMAVALARRLPAAHLAAIDLSAPALAIARENAARNGVADRIRFLEGDLLAPVRGERFDLVVSNPPYVPEGDRASLAVEVRDYEPPQ